MSLAETVLLGFIQGVTEFLPVSSSAHLVIAQNLLGVKQPQLFLDVALHFGTLVATLIVLRNEIFSLIRGTALYVFHCLRGQGGNIAREHASSARLAGLVAVGLIPTGLIGFFFRDQFELLFGSLLAVGIMLMVTGAVLWMSRGMTHGTKDGGTASITDTLIVGLVQGLAITPGISRSGSTISCGLFRKFRSDFSFHFSLLLSIPAILGAMILEWETPVVSGGELLQVAAGTVTAALVGYVCLCVLRSMVHAGRIHLFAPYCWGMGGATVILSFLLV